MQYRTRMFGFYFSYVYFKASDVLRVLQVNALADQSITDKQQWDAAVRFLESSIKDKLFVSACVPVLYGSLK